MFKKAERKKVKLKLAITGPSGSGKTYSALRLAKGLGGKVAVIDTENGSASLYSDRFEFDVLELEPPFTTDKYIAALKAAEESGYSVVIIDSASHQWAGEGGMLDRKAKLDSRPGSNSYTNWNQMTPEHERFKSSIQQSDIHTICTMRSKQEYILETNDKGKQAPKRVGLAPVQRDAMEYEFTVVFDIAMNHEAEVSKDRTGIFVDHVFQVTEDTGAAINKWLESGVVVPPKAKEPPKVVTPTIASQNTTEEYRVPFGKKFIGRTFAEIAATDGIDAIKGYIFYLEKDATDKGKMLNEQAVTFISEAEKFLGVEDDIAI